MALSRIGWTFCVCAVAVSLPAKAQVTADELIEDTQDGFVIVDRECERDGREIVVCADQNVNDQFRLPFETIVDGDPDNEGVWAERYRLQADPGTCQSATYYQVSCGAVGVDIGIGGRNSNVRLGGLRRAGQ